MSGIAPTPTTTNTFTTNTFTTRKVANKKSESLASPILKWAGGKTQLLPVIQKYLPIKLHTNNIRNYVEPFIGGGAVFFYLANTFKFQNAYLFDVNPELVNVYNSVKYGVSEVISDLRSLEARYLSIVPEKRVELFYQVRDSYNQDSHKELDEIRHQGIIPKRAAVTIFLNKTCFNGLFRVNKSGYFNVPHGLYKNPVILNQPRLLAAAEALTKASVRVADFSECLEVADDETFIYYDPPYRPLSKTSSFTSYTSLTFDDDEQRRLFEVFKKMDGKGVFQLLSNSDPTNYEKDTFFDDLYQEFSIIRVSAKRMINSNGSMRGDLSELLIKNY